MYSNRLGAKGACMSKNETNIDLKRKLNYVISTRKRPFTKWIDNVLSFSFFWWVLLHILRFRKGRIIFLWLFHWKLPMPIRIFGRDIKATISRFGGFQQRMNCVEWYSNWGKWPIEFFLLPDFQFYIRKHIWDALLKNENNKK